MLIRGTKSLAPIEVEILFCVVFGSIQYGGVTAKKIVTESGIKLLKIFLNKNSRINRELVGFML